MGVPVNSVAAETPDPCVAMLRALAHAPPGALALVLDGAFGSNVSAATTGRVRLECSGGDGRNWPTALHST